jgi:dTDP-4-dehydrorhamnose reductase
MNIPVIRLEVEGMKRSIVAALLEHQAKMDADVIAAVEAYCHPQNISRIIHEAARTALDNAIREEVKAFFWQGEGRKAVAEAVKETLLKRETYTPLDSVG